MTIYDPEGGRAQQQVPFSRTPVNQSGETRRRVGFMKPVFITCLLVLRGIEDLGSFPANRIDSHNQYWQFEPRKVASQWSIRKSLQIMQ